MKYQEVSESKKRPHIYTPIPSDDPDAVAKLKEKLEYLEFIQKRMKEANRLLRKKDIEGLRKIIPDFEKLLSTGACFCGYSVRELSKNSAQIRKLRSRIEALGRTKDPLRELKYPSFIYREDGTRDRVLFIFKTPPDNEICGYLKSWGFTWNRTKSAWVHPLNINGLAASKIILRKLVDKL